MGLDEAALILMLIGGIAVAAAGINIYRYAVIIMSAAGGYCLANMLFAGAVAGNVGNGVFKDMDGSAGQSFIVAIFVFAGAGLGFALYQLWGALVAGVGGALMLGRVVEVYMGEGYSSKIIGWGFGLLIGLGLGVLAVQFGRRWMIVFTALCGARIVGYAGSRLLVGSPIGATLAKPLLTMFSGIEATEAATLALSLEIIVAVTIIGFIVQSIIRND